jgi:hypothetical protein
MTASVLLAVLTLGSCASSFDMSDTSLAPPGPEWGLVLGSVLVRKERAAAGAAQTTGDRSATYEFDIVQIQPGDPNGESPYADRYHLDAVAGEERIFVSRLRPGQYLIKNFHRSGVTGTGGDLNLIFSSVPEEVRYIGRVLVQIPERLSHGKEYRFAVEEAREPTLARLSQRHGNLTTRVLSAPLQIRGDAPQ